MIVVEIRLRILPKSSEAKCEIQDEEGTECGAPARYRLIVTENNKSKFTNLVCSSDVHKIIQQIEYNRSEDLVIQKGITTWQSYG